MKMLARGILNRPVVFVIGLTCLAAPLSLQAQPGGTRTRSAPPATLTTRLSAAVKPYPVLAAMQRVADWELAHPHTNRPTGWVQAVGDVGIMALAGISGDPKYREAMLTKGQANDWQLAQYRGRKYHADDQCEGQVWAELYFRYRKTQMIEPLRHKLDYILNHPPDVHSLDFTQPHGRAQELWSWCDSLFMAPPTWLRLYAVTGNARYLNFAVTNWWRTTDYLYDTHEHLFFRDSTYFNKRAPNGRKIFWSRGNGWVLAGLVRVLQYLPTNHPDRPRFEELFKDMAEKILKLQQPDGLWSASLLDPKDYPEKETSGSALFTYALAWGVNQGLLDRTTFGPAVRKAWTALVACVNASGKLTHVQPPGADPQKFAPDSSEPYGAGAFLLAGSEVYRMAVFENAGPIKEPQPTPLDVRSGKPGGGGLTITWQRMVKVKVTNPSDFPRDCETVELNRFDTKNPALFHGIWFRPNELGSKVAVMDGLSSRILTSQEYASTPGQSPEGEKLLFQVDLAPHETRTYDVLAASALAAVPPPIVKTFARYVPEREDDFAWESDRIAHRMFGKALETWKNEPLTSSGVDVWVKRTRHLVINHMYRTRDLFDIHGPAQDDYKVGKTRGCGGLGIWKDGKLYVSKNWRTYRMITTGPIRSEFELTYHAWDADGRMVSETKRISIDAGSNLSRFESTFHSHDKSPLTIGIGLAERPGENVIVPDGSPLIDAWQNSTAKGLVVQNQHEGWMIYWQPQDFVKGTIGVAIVLPKGSIETFTNDNPNLPASAFKAPTHTQGEGQPAIRDLLAITPAKMGKPLVYYAGAGWSESGDFPNAKSWTDYVRRFAERRDQPLQVKIEN